MSDNNSALRTVLAENPRLMGVLFSLCLLLSKAGTVAAGNGGTTT